MNKKQTVVAGCIAGVIAACSGAGAELIGDTMRDAGAAMAGAGGAVVAMAGHGGGATTAGRIAAGMGGMLAAAGRAVSTAGRAVSGAAAGSGGGRVAGASAQEPTSDGLPRPHWVLRDKTGAPVHADVYPGYAMTTDRFSTTPVCVSVMHYDQRRIELPYRLSTGQVAKADECNGSGIVPTASWRDAGIYFLDAACTGPAYTPSYADIKLIGSVLYHANAAAPTAITMFYRWNTDTQVCASTAYTSTFWPFKAVPADVVGLLAQPPYSLELVY